MKQFPKTAPPYRAAHALCTVLLLLFAPQVMQASHAAEGCDAPKPVCKWKSRIVGIKTPNMIATVRDPARELGRACQRQRRVNGVATAGVGWTWWHRHVLQTWWFEA